MELQTLARPYARAVFELARDAETFDAWGRALQALADAVRDPTISRLVRSPMLTRDDLASLLADVLDRVGLGDVPPRAQLRSLLQLLSDNRRLTLAPAIAEGYEAQRAKAEARVDVEVLTATPDVPQAQRDALEAAIGKRLQGKVSIQWKTDAELIGGAVITTGDLVIDGSVRGELERLSQTLGH